MSRRKDQVLRGISDKDLLELVGSILLKEGNKASRNELVRIARESLSLAEIEKAVKESKYGKTEMNKGSYGHLQGSEVFSGAPLLKIGFVLLFSAFFLDGIALWIYRAIYPYNLPFLPDMLALDIVKLVGLAMLTYWFISSALRTSATNLTSAAILLLGGVILIAAVLTSLAMMIASPSTSPWF